MPTPRISARAWPRPDPAVVRPLDHGLAPRWARSAPFGEHGDIAAPQVLLVPGNPLDLTEAKLQELIDDFNTDFTTEYSSRPMGGRGVTWWEVLAIYLATKGADAVIGHATVQGVDKIVGKVRRWARSRRSATESKRPFYLELRDDEGIILRAIEFSGYEEVDVTEREREKGAKPPPEIEP